jgi:O-acetyl-ADP-ribose deacetylase (regulator of RNase III)
MLEFVSGDILRDESEALVNTVNCVGVMGRGIAAQFKDAYPDNFKAYAEACKKEEVQPGKMFVFSTGHLTSPRYIINFPTKRHWRGKSRMEDIEAGLVALADVIQQHNIQSIAVPPLGSGLGGLDWLDVRPRLEAALSPLTGVRVVVYEPAGTPAPSSTRHVREVPKMTPGRAALVELIHRYLGGLLDPTITLLEVHKLMYFMQEAGEPLRLQYVKAPCGPYAENLRHVLRAVDGHLVAGYEGGGDEPHKPLTLVPGAVEDARAFLRVHQPAQERFDRVSSLVEGFETPWGLELLATVHWVATREESPLSSDGLVQQVHSWNERKRQFTPRQINIASKVLSEQGWINTSPKPPPA